MEDTPRTRLAALLQSLEQRWGTQALVRAKDVSARPSGIPTGFAALDALGQVPLGRISELVACPTAGATTLALHLVAQAHHADSLVAYIDLARTFDPHYAALCGVDLERLWIVQPHNALEAMDMTEALITGGLRLVVLDSTAELLDTSLPRAALNSSLRRLVTILNAVPCAVVMLTLLEPSTRMAQPPPTLVEAYAAFRLWLEPEAWLTEFGILQGCRVRVTILAAGHGLAGQSVSLTVRFDGS